MYIIIRLFLKIKIEFLIKIIFIIMLRNLIEQMIHLIKSTQYPFHLYYSLLKKKL
jgi:hypothetical protein